MMKFSPDDPILTAYVLGELDPSEFAKVEAAVAVDPELQEAVSELRGLQESLVFELVVEPELELTREQRKEILSTGRAQMMTQGKAFGDESEEKMAVGILEAIESDGDVADLDGSGPADYFGIVSGGGNKASTFRLVVLTGAVAACVALAVSWLTAEWRDGDSIARDLDADRQESEFFVSSAVPEFDDLQPSTQSRATPRGSSAELSQGLPTETDAKDATNAIAEAVAEGSQNHEDGPIEQIFSPQYLDGDDLKAFVESVPTADLSVPSIDEPVRKVWKQTHFGAVSGEYVSVLQFPRADKSPRDHGSRMRDAVPEPPDEYPKDRAVVKRRTIEVPYRWTRDSPRSEIPTEVDTVSYSNVRRYLRQGVLPPRDSVHIEEMINFFDYDLSPSGDGILDVDVERSICPWKPEHHLVRVVVHANDPMGVAAQAPRNYVFLFDISGAMRTPARLGMLSESAGQLVKSLRKKDTITIITYEGNSTQLVAGPLTGERHEAIRYAFANLDQSRKLAGTPIRVAFRAARNSLIPNGENRVILVTNENLVAGAETPETMAELAQLGRDCNIGLSVAAVGAGELDAGLLAKLELQAKVDTHFLDGAGDAARFFGKALAKPSVLLANRVAVNVDFNSEVIRSYRLVGYANRPVDSNDLREGRHADVRDGYTLTALYEVIPMAAPVEENEVGAHGSWAERESDRAFASRLAEGEPLLKVNLLYDPVGEKLPKHISHLKANDPVKDASELSPDFQFAAAVAGYGLLLRESPYRGDVNTGMVRRLAEAGLAYDPHGLRREFTELVGASSAVLP